MLQSIGRACKRYLEGVSENRKRAVSKRPCPYEDCGCAVVWYWGWYERRGGSIPLDVDQACGEIPLRRFFCTGCSRTFSWRPAFLVFAHRLAANVYQQCLKNWALGRKRTSTGWHELGPDGQKSFLGKIRRRWLALLHRLGPPLPPSPARRQLWFALQRAVRQLKSQNPGFQPVQLLCIALARHPDGTAYRLNSG